ncbi:MAG: response regulator [Candidatus Omnitrophica bacterium]|nr:response regulator [Candidatus Omnitrophota bacterium]
MQRIILIAEDSPVTSSVLKVKLENEGFSVDAVSSGYALLGYLKDKEEPAVIVLDLVLPGKTGIELLSTVKNKWPGTKIFIFSAHPEYETKLYVFEDYICGFFAKTKGVDRLIKAIKKEFK